VFPKNGVHGGRSPPCTPFFGVLFIELRKSSDFIWELTVIRFSTILRAVYKMFLRNIVVQNSIYQHFFLLEASEVKIQLSLTVADRQKVDG
jgi:hypothetical protein